MFSSISGKLEKVLQINRLKWNFSCPAIGRVEEIVAVVVVSSYVISFNTGDKLRWCSLISLTKDFLQSPNFMAPSICVCFCCWIIEWTKKKHPTASCLSAGKSAKTALRNLENKIGRIQMYCCMFWHLEYFQEHSFRWIKNVAENIGMEL